MPNIGVGATLGSAFISHRRRLVLHMKTPVWALPAGVFVGPPARSRLAAALPWSHLPVEDLFPEEDPATCPLVGVFWLHRLPGHRHARRSEAATFLQRCPRAHRLAVSSSASHEHPAGSAARSEQTTRTWGQLGLVQRRVAADDPPSRS